MLTPKEKRAHNIKILKLLLLCALLYLVICLQPKKKEQVIKTPMPTQNDSIVNRDFDNLKCKE